MIYRVIEFWSIASRGVADDFTLANPFFATFGVGSVDGATVDISVIIVNDDFVEGPESFHLFISNITSTAMAIAGSLGSDTVTINDNDSESING